MPNRKLNKSISNYAYPIDNVERITVIDFFSELPDYMEDKLEKDYNYNQWLL